MLVKIGTMNLCRLVQVTKPCKLLRTDRTVNCLSRKLHISALGHGGLIARGLGIRKLHNSPVIRHGESSSNIEYKGKSAVGDFIDSWSKAAFYKVGFAGILASGGSIYLVGVCQESLVIAGVVGVYWLLGFRDMSQTRHTILRNFPVLGRVRYILEVLRPEIRQYFVEADNDSTPFNRMQRSSVYQRAKNMPDTVAFGTRSDLYAEGSEWALHSMYPTVVPPENRRITIGGPDCTQPYSAALLNVSAMSYGALSDNAILALNEGARLGGFYHNTGEGGVSRFHLQPGGDIVWNVGTGYFGCRAPDGRFCPDRFRDNATRPQIRMIEIKLSQGAKPGHGGLLPKEKVTPLIAEARGVPLGQDCHSPPRHSAFGNADELVGFVGRLRELSGGKPVGFKLCVGQVEEVSQIVHAMLRHKVYVDFITVDGAEGGTGAAPPEFSNHIGLPLVEGLVLVDSLLVGAGIRDKIKIIGSGKVVSGFGMVRTLALGADICNSARGMMFALGCIQSLKCNTNHCPTGIATQNTRLMEGLVVADKSVRVYNFQRKTVEIACDILGAMGLDHPDKLDRAHIMKRLDDATCRTYAELYPSVKAGSLLDGTAPPRLAEAFNIFDDKNVLSYVH